MNLNHNTEVYDLNKIKRTKSRIVYYSNAVLSGDIETNPGPGLRSRNNIPKCTVCWKDVGANRKRFECERCFNLTHINCKLYKYI